jgi:NAD(P)-dependent dehydrogenase (short-subunit alcohol dehydrogenase family)
MSWTADDLPDQTGRTFVITGANSGLGLEATRSLTRKGATVLMACRNHEKARDAAALVRADHPDADLEILPLDLGDLASVRAFVDALRDRPIDVLLNNAGVMAIPRTLTKDGFELQLGTNHLGHFALTALLWPTLRDRPGARVINVSSSAHRTGRMTFDDLMRERAYERWSVYGQSKLANLLFTFALARRVAERGLGVTVAAAHPGYADTDLQAVGPRMTGSSLMAALMRLGNRLLAQPASAGAWPELYAATMPEVANGDYWGPDGLFELHGHPRRCGTTKLARVEADQERLWSESERLVGVRFEV